MSHISECYYNSKVEKTEKSGNKITHICAYELKDGGYLVFKDVREMPEDKEEYYMGGKSIETFAQASDSMPDEMLMEEKSMNLKKLAELARKLV
jgi:hypothetical protein